MRARTSSGAIAVCGPAALDLRTLRGRVTGAAVRGRVRARGGEQAAAVPGAAGAGRVTVRSFRGAIVVAGP